MLKSKKHPEGCFHWEAEDPSAQRQLPILSQLFNCRIDVGAHKSMDLVEEGTDAIIEMLSKERLSALLILTGSKIEAIELHQEMLRVGALLMTVIATIEIALRNTVCNNLTSYLGVENWLRQPPAPFQWRKPELDNVTKAHDQACGAEYSKLSHAGKQALEKMPIQTVYYQASPTCKWQKTDAT